MGSLRYLKRVNRFPSKTGTFTDTYATAALRAASGPRGNALIDEVLSNWHRPSGDLALLEENIKHYDCATPKRCLDGDYFSILKKTMDELRPAVKIIPLTLGAAAKHPDFPRTTSPGFPWVTKGYHTKADVLADKDAMGMIHRAWDTIGRGQSWSLPDAMAFHRVVASEATKEKIRPVWGYPTDVVLEEARYFLPLIHKLKELCNKRDTFYGLGMETALSGHRHLARHFESDHNKAALCADLSNFDARVTSWILRDVFSHMSDWFDFTRVEDSEGKIWNVNPEQTCRRWKAMVSYFINTKIRTPSGLRVQKSHGVPSGSMFTNLLDTIVNAVQMRTAIYRMTGRMPVNDFYYGDDSVVFLMELINLDELAEILLTVFNAILSTTKTILTENPFNVQWLGYFHRDNGPERDLKFIIASTLFPEREVDNPLDSAARLLGQLYSVMHPIHSVVFYDAVMHILKVHHLSKDLLNAYVASLPSKAMKYLVTVGLTTTDIVVPDIVVSPFGTRECFAVVPKPSPRKFGVRHDRNLPEYGFTAEAYSNRHLRQENSFHDFYHYQQTKTLPFDDQFGDLIYFID